MYIFYRFFFLSSDILFSRHEAWQEVQEELRRRRSFQPSLARLREEVRQRYAPLHPQVYRFSENYLEEGFLRAVGEAREGR